jgi:hypothetical protein
VDAYLADWAARAWAAMAKLSVLAPADLATVNVAALDDLGVLAARYRAGAPQVLKTRATVPVTEALELRTFGSFTIHTTLDLQLLHRHWLVDWSRATVDPALGQNGHFSVSLSWPERAAILAADGTPLSPAAPPTSVVIGLEGTYIKNPTSLTTSLVAAGASASAVASAIAAATAAPTGFEPVFTVPWLRYEQLRPALYPIPGVFFRDNGGASSTTPPDLVGVVGTLGAITKAELKILGPP